MQQFGDITILSWGDIKKFMEEQNATDDTEVWVETQRGGIDKEADSLQSGNVTRLKMLTPTRVEFINDDESIRADLEKNISI